VPLRQQQQRWAKSLRSVEEVRRIRDRTRFAGSVIAALQVAIDVDAPTICGPSSTDVAGRYATLCG
jgi:hypothetical protein